MPNQVIATIDGAAAVLLTPEDLQSLDVKIGDAIEVCAADRELTLRPAPDATRQRQFQAATDALMQTRRSAYQSLAE